MALHIKSTGSQFPKNLKCADIDTVFYHNKCADGIGAAWCIWNYNKDTETVGVNHGGALPDSSLYTDKTVAIVDFCWPRAKLLEVCRLAKHVLVLDHHDTSMCDFFGVSKTSEVRGGMAGLCKTTENLACEFDMGRSGAQIAWDWATFGKKPRPWFIEHIGDRDLWKWELEGTEAITTAMFEGGWYTLGSMSAMRYKEDSLKPLFLLQGRAIVKQQEKDIETAIRRSMLVRFGKHIVRIAECPGNLRSKVGHQLCLKGDCDFSATYRYNFSSDQYYVSFRGVQGANSVNVAAVAREYGGGGHPCAAGIAIHGPMSPDYEKPGVLKGSPRSVFEPIEEEPGRK